MQLQKTSAAAVMSAKTSGRFGKELKKAEGGRSDVLLQSPDTVDMTVKQEYSKKNLLFQRLRLIIAFARCACSAN